MTAAPSKPARVLRIDASARRNASTSRALTDTLVGRLQELHGELDVVERDIYSGISYVNEDWINANFTDPAERSDPQKEALALSDELVAELKAADILVIGAPIYNFGVPAALKGWIDMVARARETFKYTENGPVGLLENKKAYIAIASGGTPVDSAIDFTTPYLRHVLGFIGISDVTVVSAAQLMMDESAAEKAKTEIAALAP